MQERMKNESGFTLVEAILALFTGCLVLMAIYSAINSVQGSANWIENKVTAQQDTRSAMELMAMEIQMASYNPTSQSSIWVVGQNDCVDSALNQNWKGIQEAGANSMTVEMDINGNGAIIGANNDPNEVIRYAYDQTNQYITRQVNCGAALPFLGATTANAITQTVLVVNGTAGMAGIPVFTYWDGQNNQLTAPVTTNIPNIRRIEITIVTQQSNKDIGTGGQRQIIYTTSVVPRNHADVLAY